MVRALDDILLGFLIFFTLDRVIRLFSNGIVEPWAETKTTNKNVIENWKLGAELVLLVGALFLLVKNRSWVTHFNRA